MHKSRSPVVCVTGTKPQNYGQVASAALTAFWLPMNICFCNPLLYLLEHSNRREEYLHSEQVRVAVTL